MHILGAAADGDFAAGQYWPDLDVGRNADFRRARADGRAHGLVAIRARGAGREDGVGALVCEELVLGRDACRAAAILVIRVSADGYRGVCEVVAARGGVVLDQVEPRTFGRWVDRRNWADGDGAYGWRRRRPRESEGGGQLMRCKCHQRPQVSRLLVATQISILRGGRGTNR